MAKSGSSIGPVTPGGSGIVTPLPGSDIPIVRDYPLPIATTTILPSVKALKAIEPKRAGNQIALSAAKVGDVEPYIFGRCLCEPTIISANDDGDFLVIDLLWAGHECEEIEFLTYSNINEGLGDFLGNNEHFTGGAGQTASTILTNLLGSYDTLAGKTHSVISWRQAFGLDIKAMIKGAKLYDPRVSPQTRYSANPALCLARIMTDSGYTVNDAALIEAADYCDEWLGSPRERRWEIGLQIRERQDLRYWVQAFAVYSNCFVDIQGGDVYIIPDKPRSHNHIVTAGLSPVGDVEIMEGSFRMAVPGANKVPGHVAVTYSALVEEGPIEQQLVYSESRTATTDTDAEPGTITAINLPGIQGYSRARRLAEMTRQKAMNSRPMEFVAFDSGLKRTVGDVGLITNSQYLLSAQPAVLIENPQIERGRWRAHYDIYDTDNYSDGIYSEPGIESTALQNPNRPPAGPVPSVVEETHIPYAAEWLEGYQEKAYQRFVITWTGQTWPYLKDYEVVIESEGETVLREYVEHIAKGGSPYSEQTHTLYTSFPLVPGQAYNIKVHMRSNTFAVSEEPGEAWITALVAFYSAENTDRGGAYNEWNDPENVSNDNGDTVATVEWEYDHEPESDYLTLSYSLADAGIPDDATIDWIRLDIRAWKSNNDSVVNLKDLQLIAGATSPQVYGNVKSQVLSVFSAIFGDNIYTFEGDLTYWGLTNAQALQFFDDSGDGVVRCVGECVSPLDITTMRLTVDWIKASVRFTP